MEVMLIMTSFPDRKVFVLERATGFRRAEHALRSGKSISLREPKWEDKRHRASKQIISEGEYVAELNMHMGILTPITTLNLLLWIKPRNIRTLSRRSDLDCP